MENTISINPSSTAIPKSVQLIEKLHSCAECPIRKMAMKRPHSVFAKIHVWHKTWWPGWKAHQVRACSYGAEAGA